MMKSVPLFEPNQCYSYGHGQHEAITFCAFAIVLTTHRILMNRGFLLKREGITTDTSVIIFIGVGAHLWSGWTLLPSIVSFGDTVQEHKVARLMQDMARSPLLVVILSWAWAFNWYDTAKGSRRTWNLSCSRGPFDWAQSVSSGFRWAVYLMMISAVVPVSIHTIASGCYMVGMLNLLALPIFMLDGYGPNQYVNAPHKYSADVLRVILPTSHQEGTVYLLPSRGRGFDATWSPKVANEHLETDSNTMALYQIMRSGVWSPSIPLEAMRRLLSSYHQRTVISSKELERLATWLYLESGECGRGMGNIQCNRAQGVHLIGRDLMYALCHAEYIVFMGQARLSPHLRSKLGILRFMQRSGGSARGDVHSIGALPGLQGYKECVIYIYKLLNEPLDSFATDFPEQLKPPKFSTILRRSPASIESYAGDLWDSCLEHTESTFTALYMFTTIWFIEVGNVGGFHIFPLRSVSRQGDQSAWQFVWRQAWYSCIIAQFVALSPILFCALISGLMG